MYTMLHPSHLCVCVCVCYTFLYTQNNALEVMYNVYTICYEIIIWRQITRLSKKKG
jgi:hypothetical protein